MNKSLKNKIKKQELENWRKRFGFPEKYECNPAASYMGAAFTWIGPRGFGEFHFYIDRKNGKVYCDNELMSKKFIKDLLCDMVDGCILTETK